jgi:hypothetical protein
MRGDDAAASRGDGNEVGGVAAGGGATTGASRVMVATELLQDDGGFA